jgi:hypothetical protein
VSITTPLDAASARYVEMRLSERPSERQRLQRENEALRTRIRVMVATVRTLPDQTTSAETADLLEKLAGIGD